MLLVAALVATGGLLAAPPGMASGHCDATVTAGDSIQAAVDAAALGDRVCVEPGTHAEQVVLDKTLTLSGTDGATIQAPAEMASGPAGTTAIVTVAGEDTEATLQGVNVAGPGPGACGSTDAGVAVVEGAHATVQSAEITAIRDDPLSGCEGGVGVQVGPGHDDASTAGSAEIRYTTIADFQTSAVAVAGDGNEVTVSDSTLTCSGSGADGTVAQDAVQVRRSASATVRGSTIRDCLATVDGSDLGTGIHLAEGAHDVTVADNEIRGSGTAIGLTTGTRAPAAPAEDVRIQANWIEGNQGGVDLAGPADGVLVAGNTITGQSSFGVLVGSDDGALADVGILDNEIHDNAAPGVWLVDSAEATEVHLNSFEGNDQAVDNDDLAFVDARYNWWGSPLGPTSDRNPPAQAGVAGQPNDGYVEHRPFCVQANCLYAGALGSVSPI